MKKKISSFFFTDGVTEALNPDQSQEYDDIRLIECVNKNRDKDANALMKEIITDVNKFTNNIQYDDITMIILKVG